MFERIGESMKERREKGRLARNKTRTGRNKRERRAGGRGRGTERNREGERRTRRTAITDCYIYLSSPLLSSPRRKPGSLLLIFWPAQPYRSYLVGRIHPSVQFRTTTITNSIAIRFYSLSLVASTWNRAATTNTEHELSQCPYQPARVSSSSLPKRSSEPGEKLDDFSLSLSLSLSLSITAPLRTDFKETVV